MCGPVHSQARATTPADLKNLRQSAIDKLKAALPEITNRDVREEVYRRIATELGHADPRLAFDAACMVNTAHRREWALRAAIGAWAESDFEAAYQAVLSLEQPADRTSALEDLFQKGELDSVFPLLSKVQGIDHWDSMRAILVGRLAEAGRMAEAKDMLGHMECERCRGRAAAAILSHDKELSLEKTRELVDKIENPLFKLDPLINLSKRQEVADNRKEAALTMAEAVRELPHFAEMSNLYNSFGKWADDRPQATLNLLNDLSVPDTCRQKLILEIMFRWAFKYPVTAARQAKKLEEGEEREYAEAGIILGRAVRNAKPYPYVFDDIENPSARQWAKRRFAERMANQRFEFALAVAESIEDYKQRELLMASLVDLLAEDDLDKALITIDAMAESGLRTSKLAGLCHKQSQDHPDGKPALSAACVRLFEDIRCLPNGAGRTGSLIRIGEGWAACDPVAARQVLAEMPNGASGDEPPYRLHRRIDFLENLAKYGSEQDPQGTYD